MTSSNLFAGQQYDQDDDDEAVVETHIEWTNLIFLPFHSVFELIVLICVILKCILGPIQSVYPIVYCYKIMDENINLSIIKYFYWYCCDPIYAIDTFLHIVHRQVADKALRREHLPKSAFLLLIDIVSLVPFYKLIVDENCPPILLFPNILAFSEFLVVYRIAHYFNLTVTHSLYEIMVGFCLMLICFLNCLTCFFLLLTFYGLCPSCTKGTFHDWRYFIAHKLNESDIKFTTYVYATGFITTYIINEGLDDSKPSTLAEYMIVVMFLLLGYLLSIFVFVPKIFAEAILNLRRIFAYHPHVQRLVDETRRRHVDPQAPVDVENFYNLLWMKRSGIACVPEILSGLPTYLRVNLMEDLVWPTFYHSPILRKTSPSFRRMVCELMISDYKLPGEKFFSGLHSLTNFYYLKSGTVQFISSDDGITPILSLTSGTVFGDVSFMCPPLNRKILVRCLTYCEVLFLPRVEYLKTIYKHPEDRTVIIQAAKERMKHAKTLFNCKLNVRGLDRSEDENIVWLKRRWWEISNAINTWRKTCNKREETIKCQLPSEDTVYHCAKYIGQLVLCHDTKLQKKSIFASVRFPWILLPSSLFNIIWNRIVLATVFFVLIIYPPMLARPKMVPWFKLFQHWVDFIYVADICVSLLTSSSQKEDTFTTSFASVMFERCKTFHFCLDVLAAIWFGKILATIGLPQYVKISKLNRLIKIYIIFKEFSHWSLDKNPLLIILCRSVMLQFCYIYITGYIVYMLLSHLPTLSRSYMFGVSYCSTMNGTLYECDPSNKNMFGVFISWSMELIFSEYLSFSLMDMYVSEAIAYGSFLIFLYNKTMVIAAIYLSFREETNFQDFVSNLKKYYIKNGIHADLLKRLDRYLICHWKYYKGVDIMHPSLLKNEPYDIYWKVQGEIAQKIVGESLPFIGATKGLIRELAYASKFLILPKNSTVFLFGVHCKNVTWVAQGYIKCEYHDNEGNLKTTYYERGYLLSTTSVFFGKTSVRTYTAYTDCEVLQIRIQDFYKIIKRYPQEWHHFESIIEECTPMFEEFYKRYMEKHVDYKKALRKHIFHARASMIQTRLSRTPSPTILSHLKLKPKKVPISLSCKEEIVDEHKALFLKYWMLIRVIFVVISILTAALQGGSGAMYRQPLIVIGYICDVISWIDILMKLFVSNIIINFGYIGQIPCLRDTNLYHTAMYPGGGTTELRTVILHQGFFLYALAYYEDNGIVIYSSRQCAIHYLTRGFIMDMVGALPWYRVIGLLMNQEIDDNEAMLLNTACKFAHVYLLMGYFDYLGDMPTTNSTLIIILKWQIVVLLVIFGASQFMMSYCIHFEFDDLANLVSMTKKPECWLQTHHKVNEKPTIDDLHIIYVESLNLAQCGLMRMNFGRYRIDRSKLGVGFTLLSLNIMYWYVLCYSLTLLVLNARGNVLFQHGVIQLEKFLTSERVESKFIKQALAHFTYWWMRTNGINIHHLSNERLGVVFRQDLNYYFYHKTFTALDSLLNGGKSLERQLASSVIPQYVLPRHEIVRQMDLTSNLYIIHRGKVTITQDGEHICTLTRGSIFGQLDGTIKSRPIQISAVAEDYVDLLPISIKTFHEIVSDKVRDTIAIHPTSKLGYMMTKKYYAESPYDTVRYLIGIRKTVKLPWMSTPIECRHGNWYFRLLYCIWFFGPIASTVIVIVLVALPQHIIWYLYWFLLFLDFLHLIHIVLEFYTMKLIIISNKCENKIRGLSLFKSWYLYVDLISLLVPIMSIILHDCWKYHLIRLLRLRLLYVFYTNFCTSFKSRAAPILLKIVIIFLIIHSLACMWIFVSCKDDVFPLQKQTDPSHRDDKLFIDRDQWVETHERIGGCARLTVKTDRQLSAAFVGFLKPKFMENDYIVAITYVLMLLTHALVTTVVPVTISQVYFKVFLNYTLYLLNMWLYSAGISFVYTRYRELYQHDYNVQSLLKFLKQSGISPVLLESVRAYTKQIWKRQKGDWLPELAQTAPICIRQDLFCALYMHHLQTPVLFRNLPLYFIRQVAARLKRIVVFPGKYIVQEGDISPNIFWIHEGEVEKWCRKTGENRMISLLSTNGYFGFIPGLFPNIPFQYSYCTRTVVDIVYLRLKDWQDLLDGYPDIKRDLYTAAKQMRKDIGHYRGVSI